MTPGNLEHIARAARMQEQTLNLAFQENPFLPLPSLEEMDRLLKLTDGDKLLVEILSARAAAVAQINSDPLRYGHDLPHWRDADKLLQQYSLVYVAGGKRASKSEWAAKRFVQAAITYGDSILWAFQDNETTSVSTQQRLVWKFLPPAIKALNERKSSRYKIKYQEGRGFTENLLVLPNRTQINFLTYKQDPEGFTGWELGARVTLAKLTDEGVPIPNIGAWCDENLTMAWYLNIKLRLATRAAKWIWTYSPLHGITPAIKEFRGAAKTIEERPAELLPNSRNVEDCRPGFMPYIQRPATPGGAIIYFFSQWNPFGGYETVKARLEGRPSREIKRDAYGYAEDTISRAFPRFGAVNIVRREEIPDGTNYVIADPAGARNWFIIWWRVCAGNPPTHYVYREWPDYQRFGEWAVPAQRKDRFDGDPGPAQTALGYGPTEYKRLVLDVEEKIQAPAALLSRDRIFSEPELESILDGVKDVHHRNRIRKACRAGEPLHKLREDIRACLIDPRAGRNQTAAERGGTCVIDKLAERNLDPTGEVLAEPRYFFPASGVHIEDGVNILTDMLFWNMDQDFDPVLNSPRLFVCEDCVNFRWAMENWTGQDGEDGASKDPIDCARYAASSQLRHITPGMLQVRGGGSY